MPLDSVRRGDTELEAPVVPVVPDPPRVLAAPVCGDDEPVLPIPVPPVVPARLGGGDGDELDPLVPPDTPDNGGGEFVPLAVPVCPDRDGG
jgi:hypothetical protein